MPDPTTPQWRPIETAPRDGTNVIYFVPGLGVAPGFYDREGTGDWWVLQPNTRAGKPFLSLLDATYYSYSDAPLLEPTHWLPLPPPPSEEPADA